VPGRSYCCRATYSRNRPVNQQPERRSLANAARVLSIPSRSPLPAAVALRGFYLTRECRPPGASPEMFIVTLSLLAARKRYFYRLHFAPNPVARRVISNSRYTRRVAVRCIVTSRTGCVCVYMRVNMCVCVCVSEVTRFRSTRYRGSHADGHLCEVNQNPPRYFAARDEETTRAIQSSAFCERFHNLKSAGLERCPSIEDRG